MPNLLVEHLKKEVFSNLLAGSLGNLGCSKLVGLKTKKIGIFLGVVGGVWLASNIETIVPALENMFDYKFLSPDVYYISDLPSDMHWNDVIYIGVISFILCLLATIYPAIRAANILPAEALRYE